MSRQSELIKKIVMEKRELNEEASSANWNRTTPKHIQKLKGLAHKAWNWITGHKDTRTHKDATGQEYKMKKGHIEMDKPLDGPLIIKKGGISSKNNTKKKKELDHVPDISDQKYEIAQQKVAARKRMNDIKAAAHDKIAQKMATDDEARKRIEHTKELRRKKKEAAAAPAEPSHHEKAKEKLKNVIAKKRRSKKTARRTRTKKLAAVAEDAPVNNVGGGHVAGLGVGPQGEPGRNPMHMPMFRRRKPNFAGAAVFEVDSSTFYNVKLAKRKRGHWRTYLDEDDALKEVREYANSNPNKPIVLQNRLTGEMTYARYGKGKMHV